MGALKTVPASSGDASRRGVIGIDPASTGYLGLAFLPPDGHVEVVRVSVYPERYGGLARTWRERVSPHLDGWLPRAGLVVAEEPPPTMRSDSGRSGSQAVIGFGLGRCVGHMEHAAAMAGVPMVLGAVRDIRRVTRPHLPRALVRVRPSPPRAVGDGQAWLVQPVGCYHELLVIAPSSSAAARFASAPCQVCAALPRTDRATLARHTAKRDAWSAFAALWPVQAMRLLSQGTLGARSDVRESWALPGVVDAAEAAHAARWGNVEILAAKPGRRP